MTAKSNAKRQPKRQPRNLGLPKARGKRVMGNVARVRSSMDSATAKYLALLEDPCAADLAPPTYGGTGSGYLMLTKQVVTPISTATDGLLEYTPSWANQAVRLNAVAVTGTALGAVTYAAVPDQLTNIAENFRPVAACVKVYYTGSELNRSGMVFGSLLDAPSTQYWEVLTGTALAYSISAARFVRIGSEMHEYRWCPNESDQAWGTIQSNAPQNEDYQGSTLQVGFVGAYAGTVSFEITTVWEWQPKTGGSTSNGGTGIVSTPRAPVTPLSLNATLHRLGNLAEWSAQPRNRQRIMQFAQGVYNGVRMVRPALAALAL